MALEQNGRKTPEPVVRMLLLRTGCIPEAAPGQHDQPGRTPSADVGKIAAEGNRQHTGMAHLEIYLRTRSEARP